MAKLTIERYTCSQRDQLAARRFHSGLCVRRAGAGGTTRGPSSWLSRSFVIVDRGTTDLLVSGQLKLLRRSVVFHFLAHHLIRAVFARGLDANRIVARRDRLAG